MTDPFRTNRTRQLPFTQLASDSKDPGPRCWIDGGPTERALMLAQVRVLDRGDKSGRHSSSSSDDRCRNLGKGREGVIRASNETPETFALLGTHGGFAPGGVISCAIGNGDMIEFEGHDA